MQAFSSASNILPGCGIAIMLLLINPGLQAQHLDWYQVEIILFAQISPQTTDEKNTIAPAYPNAMLSISPSSDELIQPEKRTQLDEIIQLESIERRPPDALTPEEASPPLMLSPIQPEPFRLLPRDERLLNDVASNIRRSQGYRFIHHYAWRQPIGMANKATPILIQAGKHYDEQFEIDGYITIRRLRYLHVEAHLWFNEFTLRDALSPATSTPVAAYQMPPGISPEGYNKLKTWEASRHIYKIVRTHKMQQSRKMHSNSLHYIDHPYFGILVSINRYSPAPAADKQLSADKTPTVSTDKP